MDRLTPRKEVKMSVQGLNSRELFQGLMQIDAELATQVRAQGCRCCGKKLHCGDFPREPRGCPPEFLQAYSWRTSFDCSACRKRTTPASVRFLPHRVYLAAVVVLMSVRRSLRPDWLARELEVPQRTVERWRHWWRHHFVTTPCWRALAGYFLPQLAPQTLPESWLERLEGNDRLQRLVRLLKQLRPLS
jgi:hypothetical protein